MRTNIEIDDGLLRRVMKIGKIATKKAAIEEALRLTVRMKKQGEIRKLFGKVQWNGDLTAMREGRFLNWEEELREAEGEAAGSGTATQPRIANAR